MQVARFISYSSIVISYLLYTENKTKRLFILFFFSLDTFSVSGKDVGRVTAIQIYREGWPLITSPNWLLTWVKSSSSKSIYYK